MNININFLKIKSQNIINILNIHIVLIWFILAASLLIWAGYIFYFQSYAPTYATPAPIVRPQTVQKNKLETTLRDLSERNQAINEFFLEKVINPFEIRLTP